MHRPVGGDAHAVREVERPQVEHLAVAAARRDADHAAVSDVERLGARVREVERAVRREGRVVGRLERRPAGGVAPDADRRRSADRPAGSPGDRRRTGRAGRPRRGRCRARTRRCWRPRSPSQPRCRCGTPGRPRHRPRAFRRVPWRRLQGGRARRRSRTDRRSTPSCDDTAVRILLTGATGYIGAVVAESLARRGHTVVGTARTDAAEADAPGCRARGPPRRPARPRRPGPGGIGLRRGRPHGGHTGRGHGARRAGGGPRDPPCPAGLRRTLRLHERCLGVRERAAWAGSSTRTRRPTPSRPSHGDRRWSQRSSRRPRTACGRRSSARGWFTAGAAAR